MDATTRSLVSQLGAAANMAKYGPYAVGMRLRRGYEAAFPTEWERRAQMARMRLARHCANKVKPVKPRKWNGRTEEEVNRVIREIAQPPRACAYCYAEYGEAFPKRATHHTCKRHATTALAA